MGQIRSDQRRLLQQQERGLRDIAATAALLQGKLDKGSRAQTATPPARQGEADPLIEGVLGRSSGPKAKIGASSRALRRLGASPVARIGVIWGTWLSWHLLTCRFPGTGAGFID